MKEAIQNLLALKQLLYTCRQNADGSLNKRQSKRTLKQRENIVKAREALRLKRLQKNLQKNGASK
jgi:hypothetical protein